MSQDNKTSTTGTNSPPARRPHTFSMHELAQELAFRPRPPQKGSDNKHVDSGVSSLPITPIAHTASSSAMLSGASSAPASSFPSPMARRIIEEKKDESDLPPDDPRNTTHLTTPELLKLKQQQNSDVKGKVSSSGAETLEVKREVSLPGSGALVVNHDSSSPLVDIAVFMRQRQREQEVKRRSDTEAKLRHQTSGPLRTMSFFSPPTSLLSPPVSASKAGGAKPIAKGLSTILPPIKGALPNLGNT